MELIKPTADIVALYLLGYPSNKNILLSFINAILTSKKFHIIKDIFIINPFNLQDFIKAKRSISDIKALDENNNNFNIEIQNYYLSYYTERSLYYNSKAYTGQIKEGEKYSQLKAAIGIHLLDYVLFNDIKEYHTCFLLTEKDNKNFTLTDKFIIHYIELPKFAKRKIKSIEDLNNELEYWLYFFSKGYKGGEIMKAISEKEPAIKEAYQEYQDFTKKEEVRKWWDDQKKWEADRKTEREYWMQQGMQQGEYKKAIETAKEMLKHNMDIHLIANITKLPIEKIKNLANGKE